MVIDRAYGKPERLDRYKKDGKSFVIRLRDNTYFEKLYALRRQVTADSPIIRDITCQLGTLQYRSKQRHRVVTFRDFEGREIRVVTDLMCVTAEQIDLINKARWQIEVFFRWIKQYLNIPTLFGTTENAVMVNCSPHSSFLYCSNGYLMGQRRRSFGMLTFPLFDLLDCCFWVHYRLNG